jgi:MoxR-like ATPase
LGLHPELPSHYCAPQWPGLFLHDRDYVLPEDVIALAPDVLRHRIILDFSAQAEGISADDIIAALLEKIKV